AASTTQPPDDDHATPTSDTGAPPGGDPRAKPGGTAAGRDDACREHAWNSGPPRAVPDAPTGWSARILKVVPVAAGADFDGSAPTNRIPAERGSGHVAREGARMASAEAASALAARASTGQASARMEPAQAASALSGWSSAEHGSVLIVRGGARNLPAQAMSGAAGWYLAEHAKVPQPAVLAGALIDRSLVNQMLDLVARDGSLMVASELAERSLIWPANVYWPAEAPGWPMAERATDFGARVAGADMSAAWPRAERARTLAAERAGVPYARSAAERAHLLAATPMGRWYPAPIVRRYVVAMARSAAGRQTCSPHAAMATSPALAGASVGGVVVDVEGKVARPGIQMLPVGARVYEALAAAGGALPGVDVTALDLARPVADGEQLRVGIAGAPGPV
ncbi:SLBB domain-containing protein, partial [Catenulispora rubra]|uniref:SLBB domain-containing protein n=1 Tax=Catenulispora rubra TaxID=280293 RepID=UPI001E379CFC